MLTCKLRGVFTQWKVLPVLSRYIRISKRHYRENTEHAKPRVLESIKRRRRFSYMCIYTYNIYVFYSYNVCVHVRMFVYVQWIAFEGPIVRGYRDSNPCYLVWVMGMLKYSKYNIITVRFKHWRRDVFYIWIRIYSIYTIYVV